MSFICDPYLVLYLPLRELDGSSPMSRDARGRVCTATGAVWRPEGRYFDGTDDLVNCGTPSQFRWGTGDFTIILWARDTKATDSVFASKGYNVGGVEGDWTLRSHKSNGLEFYCIDEAPAGMTDFRWAGFTAIAAEWNHVAVVRTAGECAMLVNGEIEATRTYTYNLGDNGSDLELGKNPGGEYLKGFIGECLVYNRGLNPREIKHNYLINKWRFQ